MSFIEYHRSQLVRLSPDQLEEAKRCAVASSEKSLTFDLSSDCYRQLFEPDRPAKPAASVPAGAPQAAPSLTGGPGDLVKIILDKLGIKPARNCGCEAMRRRMNEWGYRGCWRHRRDILNWFRSKAAESRVDWPASRASALFVDAIRAALKHSPRSKGE